MRRLWLIAVACLAGALLAPPAPAAQATEPVEVSPGVFLEQVGGDGGTLSPAQTRALRDSGAVAPGPAPEKRIVGGSDTTIEEWPWQVAIAYDPSLFVVGMDGFERQFCGGTLVTPTIVVSAAHCFHGNPIPGGFNSASLFTAITGRTQLSTEEGQEIPFADYYAFVDEGGQQLYDPATSEWDVVVIELEQPSASGIIKLAGPAETGLWAPGRPAFVTGWGTTSEDGDSSDVLRETQIEMLSDTTCQDYWGSEYFPETQVCAGALEGGRDTCQGDSGGPLVVPAPEGEFRLVGDTSFGDGCGRQDVPAVYGRLADDPIRTSLRFAVMELTGIDIVGGPSEPAPNVPCDNARLRLLELEAKLRKAKRAVRRKADKQRARQKVRRVRGKVRNARGKVAAACG